MKKLIFILMLLVSPLCFAANVEDKAVEINAQEVLRDNYCAASENFPIGSILKVTNKKNGKFVYCKVVQRDAVTRGKKRAVNLTKELAQKIDQDREGMDVGIDRVG